MNVIIKNGRAVDHHYFWQDIKDCPLHTKVQLLGAGGLPQYGQHDGKNPFWVKWAPLPKDREKT